MFFFEKISQTVQIQKRAYQWIFFNADFYFFFGDPRQWVVQHYTLYFRIWYDRVGWIYGNYNADQTIL